MISVFATCPVGLIGDDVHAVTREMEEKLGITIFGFSCEGYKGVSQSAGHHVANNGLFQHVIGLDNTVKEGDYKVNLLGEYNIGGDAFEIERVLNKCGITLISIACRRFAWPPNTDAPSVKELVAAITGSL